MDDNEIPEISTEDIENADLEKLEQYKKEKHLVPEIELYDKDEIEISSKLFDLPVEEQKKEAVKLKKYIDYLSAKEIAQYGLLSDSTRKWKRLYLDLLNSIQKNLYGEKSVNLHLHKISHSTIASHIRQSYDEQDKSGEKIIDENDSE